MCQNFVMGASLFIIHYLLFSACTHKPDSLAANSSDSLHEEKNMVETSVLMGKAFMQEIVSNPADARLHLVPQLRD